MALHSVAQGVAGLTKLFEQFVSSGTLAQFDTGATIPPDYSLLWVIAYGRSDTAAGSTELRIRFNNDSGFNYHDQYAAGSGTTVSAAEEPGTGPASIRLGNWTADTATASYQSCASIHIPAYSNTTGFKPLTASVIVPQGATTGQMAVFQSGGHWRSTSAINRIQLILAAGNFKAPSYCAIYGL